MARPLRQTVPQPAPAPPPLQLYPPSAPDAARPDRRLRTVRAFLRATRPRQWVKNAACLAGLVFSGRLFDVPSQLLAVAAAATFCAASAAVYIFNDFCDRENDRHNPRKARRPIASGALPPSIAIIGGATLVAVAGVAAALLNPGCAALVGLYLAMNLVYSVRLKHAVLADVLVISMGFVFRVLAGVSAIGVPPTPYLVLCIFFLALLLGLAKRRAELAILGDRAVAHRPVLAKYTLEYLDMLLAVTAAMTIVCYVVYTVEGRPDNRSLIVTVPPVVYGIGRYLLLVMVRDAYAPEEILTRDRGLVTAVAVWVGLCVAVLYGGIRLFD